MKKILLVFIVPLLLFLLLAFAFSREDILTDEDRSLEKKGPNDYALYIPNKNLYSYNTWKCFDVSNIEITTSSVNYDGEHDVPSISVTDHPKLLNYDLDPDIRWNVELVLERWNSLIDGVETFCIFGAYMQDLLDETDLWYIDQIKTKNGYWKRDDLLEYLSPENEEYNQKRLNEWYGRPSDEDEDEDEVERI